MTTNTQTELHERSTRVADSEILNILLSDPQGITFDVPWGKIRKGPVVTQLFDPAVKKLVKEYSLQEYSHSVAVGEMQPGSFHRPYIRHAGKEENFDPKCIRVYKVIGGSMHCVRNGEIHEYSANDGFIVVHDIDIFSFKAGEQGCVFAIIDFPEFDLSQDVNDVV